jgi:hypothetical protein
MQHAHTHTRQKYLVRVREPSWSCVVAHVHGVVGPVVDDVVDAVPVVGQVRIAAPQVARLTDGTEVGLQVREYFVMYYPCSLPTRCQQRTNRRLSK